MPPYDLYHDNPASSRSWPSSSKSIVSSFRIEPALPQTLMKYAEVYHFLPELLDLASRHSSSYTVPPTPFSSTTRKKEAQIPSWKIRLRAVPLGCFIFHNPVRVIGLTRIQLPLFCIKHLHRSKNSYLALLPFAFLQNQRFPRNFFSGRKHSLPKEMFSDSQKL